MKHVYGWIYDVISVFPVYVFNTADSLASILWLTSWFSTPEIYFSEMSCKAKLVNASRDEGQSELKQLGAYYVKWVIK